MLNKRGINPLVATVLLIGVTIIIAVVIFAFVRGVSDQQMDESGSAFDVNSHDVKFSSNAQYDSANVQTIVLINNEVGNDLYFVIQLDGIAVDEDVDGEADYFLVGAYESTRFTFNVESDQVTLIPSLEEGGETINIYAETEEVEELELTCVGYGGECSATPIECFGNTEYEEIIGVTGCGTESCWWCVDYDSCEDYGGLCMATPICDYMMASSHYLNGDQYCVPDECWGTCEWDETYALEFDGDEDHVEVANSLENYDIGTGSISVSFWAKFDDVANTEIYVSKGHSAAGCSSPNDYGWEIYRSGSTEFRFMLCGPDNNRKWTSHQFTVDDQWHHIVSVYDRLSDTAKMYFDGEEVSSVDVGFGSNNVVNPGWKLYFGGRATSVGFDGVMDDVRIWDIALDSNNVVTLYSGEDILIENMISWWDFNQGSGTVAYDHIVGGNIGFLKENVNWWPQS